MRHSGKEFLAVLTGGLLLAAAAGAINVIAVLSGSLPVTHVTGSMSRIGTDIESGDDHDALTVLFVIMAFGVGAALCGLLLGSQRLRLGRRYGIAMLIEAGLLILAVLVFTTSIPWAMALAAMAAGLQNAMASSYGGQIVRTTHVTGILTDLGFMVGHALRGERIEGWKLSLLGGLLLAFFVGGVAGAFAHSFAGFDALYGVAALIGTMGLIYFIWRLRSPHERTEQIME
jgi:uncharacterized membrane protein YoaK (UPF0700 family)